MGEPKKEHVWTLQHGLDNAPRGRRSRHRMPSHLASPSSRHARRGWPRWAPTPSRRPKPACLRLRHHLRPARHTQGTLRASTGFPGITTARRCTARQGTHVVRRFRQAPISNKRLVPTASDVPQCASRRAARPDEEDPGEPGVASDHGRHAIGPPRPRTASRSALLPQGWRRGGVQPAAAAVPRAVAARTARSSGIFSRQWPRLARGAAARVPISSNPRGPCCVLSRGPRRGAGARA